MRKQKKTTKSKSKDHKNKTKQVKKQRIKIDKSQEVQQIPVKKEQQSTNTKYTLIDQGLTLKLNLHKQYQLNIESNIGKNIKNWFMLLIDKQKRKNKKLYNTVQFSYYPHFEFQLNREKPSDEKCSICQFQYEALQDNDAQEKQLLSQSDEDLIILKCSHILHYSCFKMLVGQKQWIKCPVCSTIFGKMLGDQPPGQMIYNVNNFMHCDGYPECGTINISYQMHAGKRGDISFPGTHRHAYLPDNQAGNQVLKLLKQAFDRKLIFTIGRSVTTGRDNQIVWNGIHHKTNLSGGSAYFGYPDPTYFDRVKLQLAAKGIY